MNLSLLLFLNVLADGFLPTVIGSEAYRKKILDDNETFTKNFVSEKERVIVCHFPFQLFFPVASLTAMLI